MYLCRHRLLAVLGWVCAFRMAAAGSDVVINELMYHPPEDRDDLQYIELFNRGTQPADLSGWALTKGVEFLCPSGTSLPPGGFAVIARDTNAFLKQYGGEFAAALLLGNFSGKLSHSGERLSLANREGAVVDSVKYSDQGAWPRGADGHSASLERICAFAPTDDPANWVASKLPDTVRPSGTPGRTNDKFSPRLPPVITNVVFAEMAAPQAPILVTATVAGAAPVTNVLLLWQTFSNQTAGVEQHAVMRRMSGNDPRAVYEAALPGQPDGTLTRFRISATDNTGTTRVEPNEDEPRPTFSTFHFANTNTALIPLAFMVRTGPAQRVAARFSRGPAPPKLAHGNALFVVAHTNRGPVQLFDHVHLQPHTGGWKIHFQHDRMFQRMTALDVIYKSSPRWSLSEPLGHEVFRRAGVPVPETGFVRLWENGRLRGFYLTVEQVNKAFLTKNGRDTGGDLFKLIWYGQGVAGQHEKKTNPLTGKTNVLALIAALREQRGDAQWQLIREQFNVEEVAGYYAACHLIANWDGFHNNHFAYDDLRRTGKWEIYPWDLDKTFGDFDNAPIDYAWYDLPLTYGSEGDVSPGVDPQNPTRRQRGNFGGLMWWRRGGYFSRPLLANEEFKTRFRDRLRALVETEFTEEKLYPWINDLERRLEPEVRIRALANGAAPKDALQEFHDNIESLRGFVRGRRAFLLQELPSVSKKGK